MNTNFTELEFWNLIDAARRLSASDPYEYCNHLKPLLEQLSAEQIMEFDRTFYKLYFQSYRNDLWGAAFIMNGGCSDDGFDYFRAWLITQGKRVFDAALANPDSLALAIDEDAEDGGFSDEDMLGVARRAWKAKTGKSDDQYFEGRALGQRPSLAECLWADDNGDIDEHKGKQIYPKLWKRFFD
jgi:hypothetical protein